jgi:hypothetical protein
LRQILISTSASLWTPTFWTPCYKEMYLPAAAAAAAVAAAAAEVVPVPAAVVVGVVAARWISECYAQL